MLTFLFRLIMRNSKIPISCSRKTGTSISQLPHRRGAHTRTSEAGVWARPHSISRGTNTPVPRPKFNISPGGRISFLSDEQARQKEKLVLLDRMAQQDQNILEREECEVCSRTVERTRSDQRSDLVRSTVRLHTSHSSPKNVNKTHCFVL